MTVHLGSQCITVAHLKATTGNIMVIITQILEPQIKQTFENYTCFFSRIEFLRIHNACPSSHHSMYIYHGCSFESNKGQHYGLYC